LTSLFEMKENSNWNAGPERILADCRHLLSSEGRDRQDVLVVVDVNAFNRFSVAGKEAVVAPGHVVVEHGTPQPQVVRQRLRICELSSKNRGLATPEDEKLEQIQ